MRYLIEQDKEFLFLAPWNVSKGIIFLCNFFIKFIIVYLIRGLSFLNYLIPSFIVM